MNEIRQFVERIIVGSKEAPQGRYNPTLVVGLGGTGLRVLRNLKKRLAESDVNQVRLFGIDSDNSENEKYPDLPPLNQSELAILNAEVAVRCLERAAAGHTTDAHILEFLPNEYGQFRGLHQEVKSRITSQKGAGQLRRAGKLLFCSNVSGGANLNARVSGVREQLTGLSTTVARIRAGFDIEQGVRIYITGSIAGGTGAGCILDCLALLRKHFNTEHDIITAVLLLPGPLFDKITYDPVLEKAQTRGNAIGVLRELQPFIVQGMGKHHFVFDQHTAFQLGTSTLVNDVYLVDHHTFTGRQAKDNMDLYRGISHFLYALVGSGVGASQVAGKVNGNVTIDHKSQSTPLVYNSFGVGAVEYPLDDLLEYSVRSTLRLWLDQWIGQKPDAEKERADVDNFVTSLGLRDLDDLREKLLPEVEEARLSEDWKRNILKESDEQFIGRTLRRRENLASELQELQGVIDQKAAAFIQETNQKFEAKALEWIAGNNATAKMSIGRLRKHLEELAEDRRNQADKREANLNALNTKLQKKERWINILDMGLDTKPRKEYLAMTEQVMKGLIANHLDPNVADALTKLLAKVAELETSLSNLRNEVSAFHANNRKALHRIETSSPESCFIQTVLAPGEYPKWLTENQIAVTACGAPKAFGVSDLLEAALTPVIPSYRRLINGLDLKTAAVKDKATKNAIVATNAASEPLIDLIPTAPLRQEMVPQKFAAGPFANNRDPFIAEHFTQVGAREVDGLPTGDKHRVICIQTVSGFAAVHWKGFDVAEAYYREKEWRYHTFPSTDGLPRLRPIVDDDAVAFRHFGLGLVFELIASRGANYYQNFVYHEPEQIHYYLLYKADPNAAAAKLTAIQPALIKPADKDKTRPQKKYLLGDSLEEAFEKFRTQQSAAFVQSLYELIEDFIAHVGKLETQAVIENYITNELVPLIDAAVVGSGRRKILEDVRDALRAYAKQLV
jgi:hypothetical protein